jgi:hypothetical protein
VRHLLFQRVIVQRRDAVKGINAIIRYDESGVYGLNKNFLHMNPVGRGISHRIKVAIKVVISHPR